MQKYLITSTFIILLASFSLFAQLNPNYLTQYTEKDGLPGVMVRQILVDRQGYIWAGTINGLARFDGYDFKRYFSDPNDSAAIEGMIVWSIFEDSKGQIWVGASPGHLNVFDPVKKSFRKYNFEKLIKRPVNTEIGIAAVGEDARGRIYLGVTSYYGDQIETGLLYIDEKNDEVKKIKDADNQDIPNVYNITRDAKGNLWALSYNGLLKIDTTGKLSYQSQFNEVFTKNGEYPVAIKFDEKDHIWGISNTSRLYDYNPGDHTINMYKPEKSISDNQFFNTLEFDKNGHIWIGSSKGLIRFNINRELFETYSTEFDDFKASAAIMDMEFDDFGTLWMGSEGAGLFKYDEKVLFKSYTHNKDDKTSLLPGWAPYLYETSDGKIWITTSGISSDGGLNVWDPESKKIISFQYKSFLPENLGINGFYENTPGELVISTQTGNYQYNTKTNRAKKIVLPGVPDNAGIIHFFKDSKERHWLCTYTGLYKQNKGSELFEKYDLSQSGGNASSIVVTRAHEGSKHGVWFITGNGLYLYDYSNDNLSRHGYDTKAGDIFNSQDINSVYETADGTVWVGTWGGGLSKYNVETRKITTYTRENGLPSMSIQGILADEANKVLWLSTFEGLSRFDIATEQFNNYSISDGIQGQLFADGASLKTSKGLFLFGGANGFTVFDPRDINKKSIPPRVFLTDFKLFNKSVLPGENSILKDAIYNTREIVLTHDQNNLTLEFLAIHYANPSKNKYAYKLENYDSEWREVGNQRTAFYSGLPPGNYIFRLKAANNNGVWNEEGVSLKITVKPPWWRTTLAYISYLLLLIVLIFFVDRFMRHKIIEREREMTKDRELKQAKEIEKAYTELKATQAQLIQSEKMASLGELTAGIAHEIQNPLNFVNNFSEVSSELVDEMNEELTKGNLDDAKEIATDLKQNLEKITHHGKRAGEIVKGMLLHSRTSSGQKELTDINVLADEYLRLAYHGLRAKDKSFNSKMDTDFDPALPKIEVVPQDIGRVILNLITNAFYAVNEKAKQGIAGYEPTVSVSTKKKENVIEISVKDNGNGIPEPIKEKIFQPFFTTKPTGQGTGLGLSLSYDIVKAHGGELNVETKEGEGTEFIIKLPVA